MANIRIGEDVDMSRTYTLTPGNGRPTIVEAIGAGRGVLSYDATPANIRYARARCGDGEWRGVGLDSFHVDAIPPFSDVRDMGEYTRWACSGLERSLGEIYGVAWYLDDRRDEAVFDPGTEEPFHVDVDDEVEFLFEGAVGWCAAVRGALLLTLKAEGREHPYEMYVVQDSEHNREEALLLCKGKMCSRIDGDETGDGRLVLNRAFR